MAAAAARKGQELEMNLRECSIAALERTHLDTGAAPTSAKEASAVACRHSTSLSTQDSASATPEGGGIEYYMLHHIIVIVTFFNVCEVVKCILLDIESGKIESSRRAWRECWRGKSAICGPAVASDPNSWLVLSRKSEACRVPPF